MPRRIVGSANFDLFASLTPKTEKIFLRLFADIIHKVFDAELSGALRTNGIESDAAKHCNYRLIAKIMLTADTIVVRATSFSGPDTEDDEDDRNDDHDICEFEFERDRGQWRLVQTSGIPLPIPDLVHRIASPEPSPTTVTPAPTTIDIATRFASGLTSNLRNAITSTVSHLPHVNLFERMARTNPTLRIFISYARVHHSIQKPQYEQIFISGAKTAQPELNNPTGTKIAFAVLNSLRNTIIGKITIDKSIWLKTAGAVSSLLHRETSLTEKLNNFRPDAGRITSTLTEQLRRSPAQAEKLLCNLIELAAAESTTMTLRRANRATWKALIIRPLTKMCDPSENRQRIKKSKSKPTFPHFTPVNPSRQKSAVSKIRAHEKSTDSPLGHTSPRDQNSPP